MEHIEKKLKEHIILYNSVIDFLYAVECNQDVCVCVCSESKNSRDGCVCVCVCPCTSGCSMCI